MAELTDVKGIGKAAAKKLVDQGIDSLDALANIDDPKGHGVKQDWIDQAKVLLASQNQQSSNELTVKYPNLSDKPLRVHGIIAEPKGEVELHRTAAETFERTPHFNFLVKSGHLEKA